MYAAYPTGHILVSELGTLIRSLGEAPSEAKLREVEAKLKKEDGGVVTFDEFMVALNKVSSECPKYTVKDIENALAEFDTENTGLIAAAELKRILTTMGEKLTEAEFDEVFKDVQSTADGMVKYSEVAKMLAS